MKTTVSIHDFREAFRAYKRDNFSYEGLAVLFDYLEELEADTGEELELDVIALCCDYSESATEDIAREYSIDLSECEDGDEKRDAVRDYLSDNTSVCGETAEGFVFMSSF